MEEEEQNMELDMGLNVALHSCDNRRDMDWHNGRGMPLDKGWNEVQNKG